jgi:hypothetical protein
VNFLRKTCLALAPLLCLAAAASANETVDLSGTWDEVVPQQIQPWSWGESAPWVLTFDGRLASWQEGGGVIRRSLYIQDDARAAIDFVTVVDGAFLTTKALFEVEGDVLTIREGAINEARPASIVAGDGHDAFWPPIRIYKRRAAPSDVGCTPQTRH